MSKKKYKDEGYKISLSNSVLMRARCKFCKGFPSKHYSIGFYMHYSDHRSFINAFSWSQKYKLRVCDNYYLDWQPSEFTSMSAFSYAAPYKSYAPSLFHKRGIGKINESEYLVCECGKTFWLFNQKASINVAEISNRKSDRKYPQKLKR